MSSCVDPLRLGQLQCLLRHMELIGGQLQLRLSLEGLEFLGLFMATKNNRFG